MMIVNSAKEFRKRCWQDIAPRDSYDLDFMGCVHGSGPDCTCGFFKLFHGWKPNIEQYLPSLLDIAEDNQAIYEFLQNAVDSGATHFWAFYNDDYFLVLNNGRKFDEKGLESILNIAQSTKHTADDIGRLGIGFKLAHRLVGKGNGIAELVHQNKGPVLFSWNSCDQLKSFLSQESISPAQNQNSPGYPYLLKIAITNFPADVGETVKDIDYREVVAFPVEELEAMRSYARSCFLGLVERESGVFDQGAMFFVKLGEDKRVKLDEDLKLLKNGIEYSMNELKQLKNICFNGESISKKALIRHPGVIKTDSELFARLEVAPYYKDFDIHYSFGFLPTDFSRCGYVEEIEELKRSPTFYKFFPMQDEANSMALFIHCDSFQVEANRRKLVNHPNNVQLLAKIADAVVETLWAYRESDRTRFLQLYAAILLTDKPVSGEKNWMLELLWKKLYQALKAYVPTEDGSGVSDAANVKVRSLTLDIPLDKVGLPHTKWFCWRGDEHKKIIDAAQIAEKLGLERWNVCHVIQNSTLTLLNAWLASCSHDRFAAFLEELKQAHLTQYVQKIIGQIVIAEFPDEGDVPIRRSVAEIFNSPDYVFVIEKISSIKSVLQKIGLKCSNQRWEDSPAKAYLFYDEKRLFEKIKTRLEANWQLLSAQDKGLLVPVLANLSNVGDETIKKLNVFKTVEGSVASLSRLVAYRDNTDALLRPFMICSEENREDLKKYLVSYEDIPTKIIGEYYPSLLATDAGVSLLSLYDFFAWNNWLWTSDLTRKFIDALGPTDDVLSLLEKCGDKDVVACFIRKITSIDLLSSTAYDSESRPYRLIRLAVGNGVETIRCVITIDGKNLTEFSASNEVVYSRKCNGEDRVFTLLVCDVFPEDVLREKYKNVARQFSEIAGIDAVFPQGTADSAILLKRLLEHWNLPGAQISVAQYVATLILCPSKASHIAELPEPFVLDVISYCYEKDWSCLLVESRAKIPWTKCITGKVLFAPDCTLEAERASARIEQWCGDDQAKKKLLTKIGMVSDGSQEIKNRRAFLGGTASAWEGELTSSPTSFLNWVSAIKDEISCDNQKAFLLSLARNKKVYLYETYCEEDYVGAVEFNDERYQNWKGAHALSLYKVDNVTCRLTFKNEVICKVGHSGYHYFSGSNRLYIQDCTNEEDLAAVLTKVYQDPNVPFKYEDYVSVCFDSLEIQRQKDRQLDNLRAEIARLNEQIESQGAKQKTAKERFSDEEADRRQQQRLQSFERDLSSFLGTAFSFGDDRKKREHIITCYRAVKFLERMATHDPKYRFADTFDARKFVSDANEYSQIVLVDNQRVHVQGAKWGVWFVHPNIWRDVKSGAWLCLCTGDGEDDFQIITKDNIAEFLRACSQKTKGALIKLGVNDTAGDLLSVIETLFPGDMRNSGMDIKLMVKVHDNVNNGIVSFFDKVFASTEESFEVQ